jgi:hypothetical protein
MLDEKEEEKVLEHQVAQYESESSDNQSCTSRVLVSVLIVLRAAVPIRHVRDIVPLAQMDLQPVRSNIPLVAALHRAGVSGLVFS